MKKIIFMALFGSMAAFAADIQTIDKSNFSEETSRGLVLVDFYGSWCGPCQKLSPTLDKVAASMKGQVKIVKVNIDQSKGLMDSHQVKGVPTMILFKNGKEVGRLVGYRDQKAIEDFIKGQGN